MHNKTLPCLTSDMVGFYGESCEVRWLPHDALMKQVCHTIQGQPRVSITQTAKQSHNTLQHVTPQDPLCNDNTVQTRTRCVVWGRCLQEDLTPACRCPSVWMSILPRKKSSSFTVWTYACLKDINKILLKHNEAIQAFCTDTKHTTALGTVNLITSSNL